jgi:ribose 5-phosphate isomerase B
VGIDRERIERVVRDVLKDRADRPVDEGREGPDGVCVALGADHGGFALKEMLKGYLADELGYRVRDVGTHTDASCDYPDFALKVATAVARGECEFGIMIDGAGIGSSMAANKVPGVLAACCHDVKTVVNSREHNNANVLTMGSGVVGRGLARQMVRVWLSTGFGGGRHDRRVRKILDLEQGWSEKSS